MIILVGAAEVIDQFLLTLRSASTNSEIVVISLAADIERPLA